MADVRFAKTLVLVNAAVPLALLGWDAARGDLGANPVEFVLRATGTLTLVFLLLSLAVTPARRLLGWGWLIRLRRALGLLAFGHAALHFLIYLTLDQGLNLVAVASDAVTRPFISFGLLAFGFMVPLAWTSTDAAMRRMGPRWGRLHKKVYWVGVFAGIHYWLEVKADTGKPLLFLGLLAVLLGYRWILRDTQPKMR